MIPACLRFLLRHWGEVPPVSSAVRTTDQTVGTELFQPARDNRRKSNYCDIFLHRGQRVIELDPQIRHNQGLMHPFLKKDAILPLGWGRNKMDSSLTIKSPVAYLDHNESISFLTTVFLYHQNPFINFIGRISRKLSLFSEYFLRQFFTFILCLL